MFNYTLYYSRFQYELTQGFLESPSFLHVYLNGEKIGDYYTDYDNDSKLHFLIYNPSQGDRCGPEIGKLYELTLESELTKEMLEFDEVTGLYGLIENLRLPPPDAKFAGRKK